MATAVFLVAAGVSAYATYKQGQDNEEQGELQQEWHEYNAKVDEAEAGRAREDADYEQRIHEDRSKRYIASLRSEYAYAGINLSGTGLDSLADATANLTMESSQIARQGYSEESMFKTRAVMQRGYGSMARLRGKSAARAGTLSAIGQVGMAGAMATGDVNLGGGGDKTNLYRMH